MVWHTIGMNILEEEMPSKVKITISIDETLVREITGASRQARKSRSRLVEEALQYWRRSRLEQELKEGYQAMAKEDRATAERSLAAGWEAMK
jgi:metal-responsive CopG/Arc/MetJ family transcriptional regulator